MNLLGFRSKQCNCGGRKKRAFNFEPLEERQLLSVAPLGSESLVNTFVTGSQKLAETGNAVAAMPNGGYVVSWTDDGQDGDYKGVYAQRFDATGGTLGSEFRVNTTTDHSQQRSSVAAAADGSFVIVWDSNGQDGDDTGVYCQRYAANGQPLGSEFRVNVTTQGAQENASVACLADGGFVVTWNGKGTADNSGVFGRRYASDGTPSTGEFLINSHTDDQQQLSSVAALPSGGFLVAWQSHGGQDGDATGIYAQRYDSSANCIGSEFRVNTTTNGQQQYPAVGVASDGGFTIAWQSSLQDGSGFGIFAQRYNVSAQSVGDEFRANAYASDDQVYPSVAYNDNGGVVIAWNGKGTADSNGVFVREYAADGTSLSTSESLVNGTTDNAQKYASVVAASSGYVVAWSGNGTGDSDGVFVRRFGSAPVTTGLAGVSVNEDASPTTLDLNAVFQDAENGDSHLTYQVVANTNSALFDSVSIVNGQLTLSYAANAFGSANLTVHATDPGGLYVETGLAVNVASVNDVPTTSGISDVIAYAGRVSSSVELWPAFADVEDTDSALTYTVTGNTNPQLFSSIGVDSTTGRLTLGYAAGAIGTAALTVRATDTNGAYVETTFTANVVAQQLTLYWTPGTGSTAWDTQTANWTDSSGNPSYWVNGDDAVFSGVGSTMAINGTVAASSIRFITSDYVISSGTLSLPAGGMSVTVDANKSATIGAVIAGAAGLTKLGAGTLVLAGANTYTGGTTSSNDTLRVTNLGYYLSASGNATVNEGATYTLNLSARDPGAITIDRWSIDWGDGQTQPIAGNLSSVQHTYADGLNHYVITATAIDDSGTSGSTTLPVTVNDVAAYVAVQGDTIVEEGLPYTLHLFANDPGADTIEYWTIHWGDNSGINHDGIEVVSGNPSLVTHRYAGGPTTYTITATATDEDGTYTAGGTAGALDTTFGANRTGVVVTDVTRAGLSNMGGAMAVQPDGKIVVANYASNHKVYLTRYLADGTLDASFGENGIFSTDMGASVSIYSVVVQADGKIVATGALGGNFCLVRCLADGTQLDSSFGTAGIVTTDFGGTDTGYSVAVQADGKIVAVGTSANRFAVARYNADGSPDTTFNGTGTRTDNLSGSATAYAVAIQADGKIVAAGNSNSDIAVARYTVSGSLDTTFNGTGVRTTEVNGSDYGYAVAIQPDGKIVVGGQGYKNNKGLFALVRYTAGGQLDTSTANGNVPFGTGGKVTTSFGNTWDQIYGLTIQADGKIVAAGQTDSGVNGYDIAVARYASNGQLDTTFGSGGKATTNFGTFDYARSVAVAVQPDGRITAAGIGNSRSVLVRYQPGAITRNVNVSACTWTGAGSDGKWSNPANWLNGMVPVSGSRLVFVGTPTTVENDLPEGTVVKSIEFATSGFTLTGNNLTVTEGITLDSTVTGAEVISLNIGLGGAIPVNVSAAGATLLLSGILSGTGSLVKLGGGTLLLAASNTYSGGTTVTAGTLQLGSATSNGSVLGDITNNAALVFANSAVQTYGGVISGTGTFTKTGDGRLILTGANTYAGGTTITAGVLQLGDEVANGSLPGDITNNAALVIANGTAQTINALISGTGSFTKTGPGTLTLNSTNTYAGDTSVSAGILQLGGYDAIPYGSGKGNVVVNGTLDLYGMNIILNGLGGSGLITCSKAVPSTIFVGSNDQNGDFSGTIENGAGTIGLVKIGTGTLTLGGHSTYSDETGIVGGTLKLGTDNALPTGGVVRVGDSSQGAGTLDLDGHNQTLVGLYTDAESSFHRAFWDDLNNTSGTAATLTLNESGSFLYAGNISGRITLEKRGYGKWIFTGSSDATVNANVYNGTLDLGVEYRGTAQTVAGDGNPQLIRRVTPYYAQLSLGAMSGTGAGDASGSLTASTSPVMAQGDWKTAVLQAVNGVIHINSSVADYSFGSNAFLIGTVEELKMAIDGNLNANSGKFTLYQNPAYPELYNHTDTKLIVLDDHAGQPGDTGDYSRLYWLVNAQELPWLTASVDHATIAAKQGQQVLNTGRWQDLNVTSPSTLWASVGCVCQNSDGTWMWSYRPGDDPSAQTVTITLSDSGVERTTTFTVLTEVAPTTSGIASLTLDPGTPSSVIQLWPAFADRVQSSSSLSYQVVGNTNTGVIESALIDPQTGQLTLTYAAGVCGESILTVRATNAAGLEVDATFSVMVDPDHEMTWTGGATGDWYGDNWYDEWEHRATTWPTAPGAADRYIAVFNSAVTVSISGNVIADGIKFNASGSAINGGTLTFRHGSEITAAAGTSSTINSAVIDQGDTTKNGGGTVHLGERTSISGGTVVVSEGTLQLDSFAEIDANVTWGANGTIEMASTAELDGVVTVQKELTFGQDEWLVLGDNGELVLQEQFTLAGGNLKLNDNTIVVADTVLKPAHFLSGTIMDLGGIENAASVAIPLTKTDDGDLVLLGVNRGAADIKNGTLQLGNGATNGVLREGTVATASGTFIDIYVAAETEEVIARSISGNATVRKTGPGTAILTGINTYTGGTEIDAGTLQVGVAGGAASSSLGTGDVTFARGVETGTLVLDSCTGDFVNNISGPGDLVIDTVGTITLTGYNTFTGTTRIKSGTVKLGSNDALRGTLLDMNSEDEGTLTIDEGISSFFVGAITGSRDLNFLTSDLHVIGRPTTAAPLNPDGFSGHITAGSLWGGSGINLHLSGNNMHYVDLVYVEDELTIDSGCSVDGEVILGPKAEIVIPEHITSLYFEIFHVEKLQDTITTPIKCETGKCKKTTASKADFKSPEFLGFYYDINTSVKTGGATVSVNTTKPNTGTCNCTANTGSITVQSNGGSANYGNGSGVVDKAQPTLQPSAKGGKYISFDDATKVYFDFVPYATTESGETPDYGPDAGAFKAANGGKETLVYYSSSDQYVMTMANGTRYTFHGLDTAKTGDCLFGTLMSEVSPSGEKKELTWSVDNTDELNPVLTLDHFTRSYASTTDGGTTTAYEQNDYGYYADGSVGSVTLKKWSDQQAALRAVSRVLYVYYRAEEAFGSAGDLKKTITQFADSNGNFQPWDPQNPSYTLDQLANDPAALARVTGDTYYFRYYTEDGVSGWKHDVRRVLLPNAYANACKTFGGVAQLESAAEDYSVGGKTIADFTCFYFEYDQDTNRVTKEVTFGQTGAYPTDSSTVRPGAEAPSEIGYNRWERKTVQHQLDGSISTVFTNYVGQTMLTDLYDPSTETHSVTYNRYDDNGDLVLTAQPSAFVEDTGGNYYNESSADLINLSTPDINHPTYTSTYLNNSGLFNITTYYSSTDAVGDNTTAGGAPGYVHRTAVANSVDVAFKAAIEHTGFGATDGAILQATYDYYACWDGAAADYAQAVAYHAAIIYPVAHETTYTVGVGDAKGEETTTYQYTWYNETVASNVRHTLQMATMTTQLPVVADGQNGSGVVSTTQQALDRQGHVTATTDARGVVTNYGYDPISGLLDYSIQDPTGLNLRTDYQYDGFGRVVQTLGPVHTVDVGGSATTVRTAAWTVYKDNDHETWTAGGYVTVNPSTLQITDRTLENPLSIKKTDKDGNVTDQIQATWSGDDLEGLTSVNCPALNATQLHFVAWTASNYANTKLSATAVYYAIPTIDWSQTPTLRNGKDFLGTSTNYTLTQVGYEDCKANPSNTGDATWKNRQNKTVAPDGTITRVVYNARGNVVETWMGTNDADATDANPHPSTATGNNMVRVSGATYEPDGTLIQSRTYYGDASTDCYATDYYYDWRDRQTDVRTSAGVVTHYVYNNLGQVTDTLTYADVTHNYFTVVNGHITGTNADTAELRGQTRTSYDALGRVIESRRYEVNPATGAVGDYLPTYTWYDAAGRTIKTQTGGSFTVDGNGVRTYFGAFTKSLYDSLGRLIEQYTGFDGQTGTAGETTADLYVNGQADIAASLSDDTIVQQIRYWYDAAGETVATASYQRLPGSTIGDALNATNSYVTASAVWYDPIGRAVETVIYGREDVLSGVTHYFFDASGDLIDSSGVIGVPDGAEGTRPATNSSDNYIVVVTQYNAEGQAYRTVDNLGRVNETQYDDAGRVLRTIQNYNNGTVEEADTAQDITEEYQYDSKGRLVTMTAYNAKGGDNNSGTVNVESQATKYLYTSTVNASLQTAAVYPDSADVFTQDATTKAWTITGSDHASTDYDRLGRKTDFTDQRGVVHHYDYDPAGRLEKDVASASSWGSVDHTVVAIGTKYDDLGRVKTVTSYGDAGCTSVVNDVQYVYDGWGNLAAEYQAHDSKVDSNGDGPDTGIPYVQYHYGDGLPANSTDQPATYVRLDKVTYPNGREIGYNYAAGVDNIMSRLSSISDSVGNLAEYTYLGLSTIAKETRPQVSGGLTLDYDPDGNGTFTGFDRFGRVVNQLWKNTARTVVDGYRYGYDRSGNVTWKQNATPGASGLDEHYAYDEVYRLTNTQRGTLVFDGVGNPGITNETKYQDWTLDGLGDFAKFDDNGTPQTRTTNAANEIETITGGTVTPEYDSAGNMISGPSSNDASVRLHYVYDAWNRLVAVYADNSGSLGNLIAAYEYDGANRRIEKAMPAGSTTDFYYNQQWQLLEERTTAGTTTTTDQYVWDQSYIDAPIVRFHDDPDDTIRYYTWDANHNVTTTITVDAAATTTVKHNVYDAYGKATAYSSDWSTSLGAPTENGPLYCGYMFDVETGNYLARNRYYSVVLATWISRDPIGYKGGINQYEYVADAPVNAVDPTGNATKQDCEAAITKAIVSMSSWEKMTRMTGCSYGNMTCHSNKEDAHCAKGFGEYYDTVTGEIVGCYENEKYGNVQDEMAAGFRHEIVHNYDSCSQKGKCSKLDFYVCTEIRAAAQNCAEGSYTREYVPKYKDCIFAKALLSLMSEGWTMATAKRRILELYETCVLPQADCFAPFPPIPAPAPRPAPAPIHPPKTPGPTKLPPPPTFPDD